MKDVYISTKKDKKVKLRINHRVKAVKADQDCKVGVICMVGGIRYCNECREYELLSREHDLWLPVDKFILLEFNNGARVC